MAAKAWSVGRPDRVRSHPLVGSETNGPVNVRLSMVSPDRRMRRTSRYRSDLGTIRHKAVARVAKYIRYSPVTAANRHRRLISKAHTTAGPERQTNHATTLSPTTSSAPRITG